MRKQLLLLKALLVTVLMGVGTSAWADDYTVSWQDTFDEASTYAEGWSLKGSRGNGWTYTQSRKDRTGEEKYYYYNISNGGYNTMATYDLSGISAFDATDYIFEMDYAMTANSNNLGTTSMVIYDNSATPVELFKIAIAGLDTGKGSTTLRQGSIYVAGSATAETPTVTMNTFRGGTLTWYHITIVSNATEGTKLTLTKCDDATETNTFTISANVVRLGKIYQDNCGANAQYYGAGSFDNFVLKTPADATSVSAPTGTITDFDGTSRTVSLSTLTDGATIYYSTTINDTNADGWTTYSVPFETTASPVYAYAKKGDYTSEVTTFVTGAGAAFKLSTPSWKRTGANAYTITATATSALGVDATQTIHYTINGGTEQISTSPAELTDVDGNIVAWTTASKFGQSDNLNVTYVEAIATTDAAWSYNLNSYPQAHTCDDIASALDTENGKDISGTTMYNLKEENYPNLYIENASGWLLRKQANNAWKCQSARTSIAFDNVTTSDVIYIQATNDNGSTNCIYAVSNGTVKYNYSLQHFYIVPDADGAVKVTFNTGSSLNTMAVYNTTVSTTLDAAGYATFASPYALDVTSLADGVKAYKAAVSDDKTTVVFNELDQTIPANTGILLKGGENAEVTIPVAASGTAVEGNAFKVNTGGTTFDAVAGHTYYGMLKGEPSLTFAKFAPGTVAIPATKAYLDVEGGSAARLRVNFGGETTAIGSVKAVKETTAVYNLQGQRVKAARKGLYIVNGKKVIK